MLLIAGCLLAISFEQAGAAKLPKERFGTYGQWHQDPDCRSRPRLLKGAECKRERLFAGVVIAPADNGQVRVWYQQWGQARFCEIDAVGSWNGDVIVARQTVADIGACDITIRFGLGGVSTNGAGDWCSASCGSWIESSGVKKLSTATEIPARDPDLP
jgi:hypothetical protein